MVKNDLLKYERKLFSKGYKIIAGVDEVGRGPIAGPMVFSAVIMDIERILNLFDKLNTNNDVASDLHTSYAHINDSKKLSPTLRCSMNNFITNECISYSIFEISHLIIDKKGIGSATQTGFYESINSLEVKPDFILTDHFEIKKITQEHQKNIDQGDSKSITIAAASILAKVYRDNIMVGMHSKYPVYGFDRHKGYGTKQHIDAINKYGICEIHRKSFEPIKSLLSS